MDNTWKARWLIVNTDDLSRQLIVCENCGISIGDTNMIPANKCPPMCPSCKRDMVNGPQKIHVKDCHNKIHHCMYDEFIGDRYE